MGEQFLVDNPTDPQLPQLRLAIATDHLAFASKPLDARTTSQEMLAEVTKRFNAARAELAKVTTDFPEERALIEDAQWRIATSFLTQARTVDAFSATLARGQFVRAAKELRRVANEYAQHPQIGTIPQMLWDISMELHNRNYHEEALSVWNVIAIDYPTHPLAQQAEVMTAQTYQSVLGRPLRAAEVYLEINFARGGNDATMQNAVFAIGADLKNQKRWIESLRVLENFVQSFPNHPQAGQALTMIGQIHQANDAWQDAIAAYRRVINEFPASGQWVQDAKWAIAECTINLSQWKEAVAAYEAYVASFPKDGKIAEANRRIGILKDLANYQKLVDEKGPKAYDAQFQIAMIVNAQLGNWRKAVEEYQKVATNWPKSHLAADALHSLGLLYLQNGDVDEARTALRAVATSYPDSPFACDSLFQVGKSYEDEANRLGTVTRAVTLEQNKDAAQRRAYISSNITLNYARSQANEKVLELRIKGKKEAADLQMAQNGGNFAQLNDATINIAVDNANREQEDQTAGQLADRQDKINAALRKAVAVYAEAAKVPGGDKAGESLLHMAVIYNDRLGDKPQAMTTWLEIVRQFSGTAVAEEASWQIAQHYEKAGQYAEAVEAYKSFLRNYRRSPKAADAQFFIAENYEHLEQWISAMDQYTNYVQNFPEGGLIQKAREQISFIKTYRL
jgi:TolA-binding protein